MSKLSYNICTNIFEIPNAFSVEECQKIITNRLRNDLKPAYAPGMVVDPDIRSSMINFMYDNEPQYEWIFDRVWEMSREHPLGAIVEKLPFIQFAEYDSHYAGHFKPHRDTENFYHATDKKHFIRTLTIVINLTDPQSFSGGDIKIYDMKKDTSMMGSRERGCAIMFPSNKLHEVTKVTSGIRYSLSCWFEGRK